MSFDHYLPYIIYYEEPVSIILNVDPVVDKHFDILLFAILCKYSYLCRQLFRIKQPLCLSASMALRTASLSEQSILCCVITQDGYVNP